MRFALSRLERNFDHRIQSIDFLSREVTARVKNQTIDSGGEILTFRQQLCASAILVGMG